MKPLIATLGCVLALSPHPFFFSSGAAEAAVVLRPPDLNPGDRYRLVFVTSGKTQAESEDIEYYNGFVDGYGDTALDSDWRAIGSTSMVNARDKTDTTGSDGVPLYRLDGERVANDYADLRDESLLNPIKYTESGSTVTEKVWTGTDKNCATPSKRYLGTLLPSGNEQARVGNSSGTTGGWFQWGYDPLTNERHVYGISEVLSVPFELKVTRATAWRNASKPGRVRYEGLVSGLDFSNGLTFTVTDGASLDQSGSVPAVDCTTARNGRVHCSYRDLSVHKKLVQASFRPTKTAGEYRYKVWMNKLDVPAPQGAPLGLLIDDGTELYEGSASNCTEQLKKLMCRD